ncbi:MAG: hypothetical protein V3R84_08585, partial [Acidimicrobiia bacterium]
MSNVLEHLVQHREYLDDAAPPLALGEVTDRARRGALQAPTGRPRRGWAIAVAAAVITILVVAVPLLLLGRGSEEAPVVTEPSPQPTVVTTVPPPTTEVSATTLEPVSPVEAALPQPQVVMSRVLAGS